MLLGQEGRQGKIKFLERFAGVGPKYARNTMMDLYHEEFRDSVAVDARIQGVSIVLGVEFANYEDHEDFYCSVAREAGLEAWEVDRLLYWFNGEVLSRLDRPESGAMQQLLKRIAELEERVAELEALEVTGLAAGRLRGEGVTERVHRLMPSRPNSFALTSTTNVDRWRHGQLLQRHPQAGASATEGRYGLRNTHSWQQHCRAASTQKKTRTLD